MHGGTAEFFPDGRFGSGTAHDRIKIRVQYFGAMRVAAGRYEEELELPSDTTLYQFLGRLCGTYGEAFRGEVFREDGESIRDDLILALNGAIIEHTNVIATGMSSGDAISLFPIFPGGG